MFQLTPRSNSTYLAFPILCCKPVLKLIDTSHATSKVVISLLSSSSVYLNLFNYVAHRTFGENCVADYLVSMVMLLYA